MKYIKNKVSIRHIGLVVKNLNLSLDFWCKTLNFKIISDQIEFGINLSKILNIKNVKVRTIKIRDHQKNLLELLYFINPKNKKKKLNLKTNSYGFTHMAVSVKNIDKIYKQLKRKRIKFNSPPQLSENKKVKFTNCKTPEDVFLEIVQPL